MTRPLPAVYPIVDSAEWVERLAGAGARLIQLRIKERDEHFLRAEIRKALTAAHRHKAALVVNDYWHLALEEGATWLHLGQEDMVQADLAAIRRAGIRLGLSTHDEAELALALAAAPDYIALGPIFPTTVKVLKFSPQGIERISQWKQWIADFIHAEAPPGMLMPALVAIGGITLDRARLCLDAGADSVAVVTDIVHAADPEARCRDWLAATSREA